MTLFACSQRGLQISDPQTDRVMTEHVSI